MKTWAFTRAQRATWAPQLPHSILHMGTEKKGRVLVTQGTKQGLSTTAQGMQTNTAEI